MLINKHKNNPGKLADVLIDIGSRVSFLSDKFVELELERAKYWNENEYDNDDKRVSDTKLKMKWILTDKGKSWFVIKKDMSACETARRTISKALEVKTTEAYNQY